MPEKEEAASLRVALSRHPVAVECARAAGHLFGVTAEVVVFESGRSFVAVSTGTEVLQPRPPTNAEQAVMEGAAETVFVDGVVAVPIPTRNAVAPGALVLHEVRRTDHLDTLTALARLLAEIEPRLGDPDDAAARAEAILDGQRDAVVVVDADLVFRYANRAVGSLFSRSPSEFVGNSALDFLHPDDLELAADGVRRLSEGREMYRVLVRVQRGGGGYERVEVTGTDRTIDPAVNGFVLSLRSVEGNSELEAAADRSQRMSAAIVEHLHDGIVATDRFGDIATVNDAAREMFGIGLDVDVDDLTLVDFVMFDSEGRPLPPISVEPGRPPGDPSEVCVVSAAGELRYVALNHIQVLDRAGTAAGSVLAFQDMTAARRAERELSHQALHDQLTGLPNRRRLDNRLRELARIDTSAIAACFIDLDGFKMVNDTHGHRLGDQLIQVAAQRLKNSLRDADLIARQGGDEFVALFSGVLDPDLIVDLAERLRVTLGAPYVIDAERFDLTASIGVAFCRSDEVADDLLLRQADLALYAAKARGRNRVERFDGALAAAVEIEERQRRTLRTALEARELMVHFQPIVAVESGRTVGYEALSRCRGEKGEVLSPGAFMGAIQGSGIMWDLDRAAFQLSCEAATVLNERGDSTRPEIACNFSPVSLVQPGMIDFVTSTTQAQGLDPSQFCIEITESSAFESGPVGLEAIQRLSDAGFRLALDDFGTGYSSLAHLRDLPLDVVKVDRSFIAALNENSSERMIVKSIVNLGNDLGLDLVAEGVETEAQYRRAVELGFGYVQGWHFAPARSLAEILSERRQHSRTPQG